MNQPLTIAQKYFLEMDDLRRKVQAEALNCFMRDHYHVTKFSDGSVLVESGEVFTQCAEGWAKIEWLASPCPTLPELPHQATEGEVVWLPCNPDDPDDF